MTDINMSDTVGIYRIVRTHLTIVTHDEEAVLSERGRTVKVVPAWKWLLEDVSH